MFVSLPYKEIIFGLRGYSGDFFVLDELEFENNLDKKLFEDCFGESNLDSLKRLCALAVQHKIILDYVHSIQGTCCNYEKKFVAGITNSLKEFYDELIYLEGKKEQLVTLCAFHSLFKYQAFFTDLVYIVKQISSTSAIKLFETLNSRLKSTDRYVCKFYQIVFFQYKQAFFEDLWNWLIYGYLEEAENKFFIVPSDEEEIFKFATSDLPSIDPALLRRILMHGKLIALFQANYAIGWREIFADSLDDLAGEFKSLCSSEEYTEIQLTEFIKNATDVLLKFYGIHLIEKQNILSHLKLIKDTHLMGNHSFWMKFCADLVKRIESKQFNRETDLSLRDIKNCWLRNIREFYQENEVNQFQAQVQIDEVRRSAVHKVPEKYRKFGQYSKVFFFPEISISYNLPAMVRLFLGKESFKKYDVLFNFLLKLHQTRMILNKLWFENLKNPRYDKRICLITMKLTSLIEKLLFHYKVYIIEIGFCEFENEVKNYDNPSDLEQCHTKFIDRLLRESLVNIEGVHNQFLDLFAFCQKVYLTTNQAELIDREIYDLQLELNDLNSHFSLLFSSFKAHEISGSLKYLLN